MSLCEESRRMIAELNEALKTLDDLRVAVSGATNAGEFRAAESAYEKFRADNDERIALNMSELTRLKEVMKSLAGDYENQLELLVENNVLEKGKTRYISDYNGAEEKGGEGNDFRGHSFEIPKLNEIFGWLTADQIELYKEMEKEGLEPKLQLTPIGLNIRTLASKIDEHQTMPNQNKIYINDKIIDAKLKYAPTGYDASEPEKLKTKGGKSKSEYIQENKGWLIDIVATKQDIDPDPNIGKDSKGNEYTYAQKTTMYDKKLKARGMQGLTYESYLIAQMRALKERKPLEKSTWTILPDSSIDNEDFVSVASWVSARVNLDFSYAGYRSRYLRCRPSVRVSRGS